MANRTQLAESLKKISSKMTEKEKYLIELDAKFGDGDLGLSMKQGFGKVADYLAKAEENDLGILLRNCSSEFNEAAPSTLGTIISFGFMGMAKYLKGKTSVDLPDIASAMEAGIQMIMNKAKSKPGDKTILDSLYPAVQVLKEHASEGETAWEEAYKAACAGAENTRKMKGVHGRIAYYGEKTLGEMDGGAVAGMLIFEALK